MKHCLDIGIQAFGQYWGNKAVLVLFGLCCAWLLVKRRKDPRARFLLILTAVSFAVYFFPVSAKIIQTCVGETVYWRTFWILPLFPVMAYTFTTWVNMLHQPAPKSILVLLLTAVIVLTGRNAFSKENYRFVRNMQQVPEEAAVLGNMLSEKGFITDRLIAVDDYLASYLRVYDPSVHMPYGRWRRGYLSREAVWVYKMISAWPNTDYRILLRKAQKVGVDVIIIQKPDRKGYRRLRAAGYIKRGRVLNYFIFVKKKKG